MDSLTQTFGALADPTRRAILARLATGEANVGELAAPFKMSWPAVSRHLKVLEQAGLIERKAKARFRVCALRGERLGEAGAWIAEVKDFWETGFDRLDALLQAETRTKEDKP
ncbi:MAG TPA: metalloregulator ArsR/SmtB family transcription factor [Roseiarcus sp.]|nr:metalloregulator ArsR/SmtB family transcription factor [Roseiarcus sp.]